MDEHNIRGFELENPGRAFPAHRSLASAETQELRARLRALLRLPQKTDDLRLVQTLASISVDSRSENADDENFSLVRTLGGFGITPQSKLFINFYRFDEIDEMALDDVVQCFRFIWYPHSDDIDIFDSTLSWVLSVSHDGIVSLAELSLA